ncbi:hypothetical protein Gpo141_00000830 [Globisporangium polare]
MALMMDDPDPSFTAAFEPAELLRQRCVHCRDTIAALECKSCDRAFCAACENHVHAELHRQQQERRMDESSKCEEEESKGEQHAHQAHVTAINLCQVCAQKAVAFLCVDCQTYQCEACCAARHLHVESFAAHLYFCVEGSSSNLIRYAKWSPEFLEMAKMSRRMKLQELEDERVAAAVALAVKQEAANAGAASAAPLQPTAAHGRDDISNAVSNLKTERVQAAATAVEPIQDMQALSISEQKSGDVQMPVPTAEAQQPATTAAPAPSTFQTPTPSPYVKPEPFPTAPVAPPVAQAILESAPVKFEQQPPVPPAAQQPAAAATASTNNRNTVIDLTEDDGDLRSAPVTASRPSSEEPVVKRESSAWLTAATASTSSSAEGAPGDTSLAEDMDDGLFSLTDGDPIMRTMISEYNRLSEVIFNHEQEIAAIQKQIKEMLANQAADMNAVVQCSNTAAQVKNSVVKETQNRNAVVARLVVYLKQDPVELEALFDESQATDIPHMQTASHRRCAQLEAIVREKRYTIRKLKRSMEDAINMKSQDAFAEVSRLGAMIVADEQTVKESEEDRLVEFIRLFQFSKQIRNAARNMVTW